MCRVQINSQTNEGTKFFPKRISGIYPQYTDFIINLFCCFSITPSVYWYLSD
jgi:hypothetical protein